LIFKKIPQPFKTPYDLKIKIFRDLKAKKPYNLKTKKSHNLKAKISLFLKEANNFFTTFKYSKKKKRLI